MTCHFKRRKKSSDAFTKETNPMALVPVWSDQPKKLWFNLKHRMLMSGTKNFNQQMRSSWGTRLYERRDGTAAGYLYSQEIASPVLAENQRVA